MALRVSALWKTNAIVVLIVWLSWLCTVVVMTAGAIVVYLSLLREFPWSQALIIPIIYLLP
jgi:hypothetical protein